MLDPRHRRMLEQGSAIHPDAIAERGYWTAWQPQDVDELGFAPSQRTASMFPALMIPCYAPDGELTHMVMRPDVPRVSKKGKIVKYEQPAGVGLRLDVPPRCREGLRDVRQPLWWTEGAKKADSLASVGCVVVNTPGVDGWHGPSAILDLFGIPLKGRAVICSYDSDVLSKPEVQRAVVALANWMRQKGADVMILDWSRVSLPADANVGGNDA